MTGIGTTLALPDRWHAPSCYWFWHSIPDAAQIDEQIDRMVAAGYRSFQIQPRRAFPLEDYLTEAYFVAYRRAVERAAQLGLLVGVYDDYNWQTGQAAGLAVAASPGLRERHVFWSTAEVGASEADVELTVSDIVSSTDSMGPGGMSWHYDGSVVHWAEWQIVRAIAKGTDSGVRDVTANASIAFADELSVRVSVEPGALVAGESVTVFVAATCSTSRLINYLDPAAVDAFIQAGYQPYYDHLAEHFGTTIGYFFFDQPHANFYTWKQRTGELQASIPVSAAWLADLADRAGDRLAAMMLSLLTDVGESTDDLRVRFYEHHGEWSRRTFLGALKAWCAEHGVAQSGHEVLGHVGGWALSRAFTSWDLRVNFGLDYFAIDGYRDLTGVDAEGARPQLSAKLGDSVARWNGRTGTILEQYFGAPKGADSFSGHWGLTLAELRTATLRNHFLGMRQLVFHGFYQTDGNGTDPHPLTNARFDFAPGINYEPWFDEYHPAFALESGRLSEFLDAAVADHPVAVVYPLATVLAEGPGSEAAVHTGEWSEALFRAGIGYDIVPEEALESPEFAYRAIVLPSMTRFDSASSEASLSRLTSAGVFVLGSGRSPFAGDRDDAIWTEQVPGRESLAAWFLAIGGSTPGIENSSGELAIWRGHTDDGARMVIFNESPEAAAAVTVFTEPGTLQLRWDLGVGSCHPVRSGGAGTRLEVGPNEILAIDLIAPATLVIDEDWTLQLPGREPVTIGVDRGWESQGHATFAGTARYATAVTLSEEQAGGEAILSLPGLAGTANVTVNGTPAGSGFYPPFLFSFPSGTLRPGANLLQIDVANTAANRYYSGAIFTREPEASGLTSAPLLHFPRQIGAEQC